MMICSVRKWSRRMAAGLIGLALAACASSPDALPGSVPSVTNAALNQQSYTNSVGETYILRSADIISVEVFREEALSLDAVTVSGDGRVSLPLLGSMQVAGLTPVEFENEVERALGARYLHNPAVSINIVRYGSHVVTVEGAVKAPGVYEFIPGTRLSGGISLAEGPDRIARLSQVAVFRDSPDGREVAKFDYAAVQAGTMIDPVLQPGDRIVLGTDGLTVFWQDFLKTVPLFGLFVRF